MTSSCEVEERERDLEICVSGLGLLVQIPVAEQTPQKPKHVGKDAFILYIQMGGNCSLQYGTLRIYSNRGDTFSYISKSEMVPPSNMWHDQKPFLFNPNFILHKVCDPKKR